MKTGGPAFPELTYRRVGDLERGDSEGGMTLRDYFAGQELAALGGFGDDGPLSWVVRLWQGRPVTKEEVAERCYAQADAMLTEREE